MQEQQRKASTKSIAVLGILSALAAVFAMWLTVRIGPFIKLSPVFLAVALAGYMYGPLGGATVAFIGDTLQSLLSGLGFSPLISLVNVFVGVCFGIVLKNGKSFCKIFTAVLLTQTVGSVLLNTAALYIQYGMPLFPTVYWRLLQAAIMTVVETFTLWLLIVKADLTEKLKKL